MYDLLKIYSFRFEFRFWCSTRFSLGNSYYNFRDSLFVLLPISYDYNMEANFEREKEKKNPPNHFISYNRSDRELRESGPVGATVQFKKQNSLKLFVL